jgi:putative transposase
MRTPRLVVPGWPHHLILRGNNRRRIFSFPIDYATFLRYLDDALVLHRCALHALALMTNHVHLVVTPSDTDGLTKLVHRVGMRYAQHRNRERDGTGKLFESRFRSFPILGDGQLAVVMAYVELNPVRAGMRDDPIYRWSTYALHVGRGDEASVPRRIWTPSTWYRALGDSPAQRAHRYAEWVAACRARDAAPEPVPMVRLLEAVSTPVDRWMRRPNGLRAT